MFCLKGRTTAPNGWAAQEGSSSNKNFGVSGMQFCLDHKMLQGFFNSSSIKLRLYGSDDKLPILRRAKTCSGFVLSTNKRWGESWVKDLIFVCVPLFLWLNCIQTLLQWPFFKLSLIQLPQDLLLLGFPTQKQNPFREKSTCILLWIREHMSIVKIWSVSMLELFETTETGTITPQKASLIKPIILLEFHDWDP